MNVETALLEFRVQFTKAPEYYRVLCPFHSDSNPSGNIHHKTGYFVCFSCGKKSSFNNYLSRVSGLSLAQIKIRRGAKSDCKHPESPLLIEAEHQKLWEHHEFLGALRHRKVPDDYIRQYRLGVREIGVEKRISIPIENDVGEYATVRMYLPGATNKKFLNLNGKEKSKVRLFPIDQLEYDQILICPGEIKALAAAAVLNPLGIGAIAPTCGENTWPSNLNELFTGKLIYVNGDVDEAGRYCAELRCRSLKAFARELYRVDLAPSMVGNDPKGDLNDFLRLGGSLLELLNSAKEWVLLPGGELSEDYPRDVTFREAYSSNLVGTKVRFNALIGATASSNYLVPSQVKVVCGRNETFCTVCDVNSKAFINPDNSTDMKIGAEHPAILGLLNEKTATHHQVFKDCFRIPHACKQCKFVPTEQYDVKEVRLEEPMDPTSREDPITMKVGYLVGGPDTADSRAYILTGRLYPSPKNQVASMLISSCEPTVDTLEAYEPVHWTMLQLFRPKEWTYASLEEKLNEIYGDLEANITRIWQRRDYHLLVDLAYHSILYIDLDSRQTNAWVEVLAIGDTEQGKSAVTQALQKHYGLGQKTDCKNISLPGLTIGLEKSQSKFFAVYGCLPRNDRGLVIFEELGGMNPKVWQALTEVRSSGVVQVTKIESRSRMARVRKICTSNPERGREVGSYTYGIDSAFGVVQANEDLRRFDAVMILGKADIEDMPEKLTPPTSPHIYTQDICQKLILKAWKCENAEIEGYSHLLEKSRALSEKYSDGGPLLATNGAHIKIAKLSAALAARTASYEGELLHEKLVVRKCHVDYICDFLDRIYSTKSSRLHEKSLNIRETQKVRDRANLIKYLKDLQNAADICRKLLEVDLINAQFIRDLCGDLHIGGILFSRLIQSNAINRIDRQNYCKTKEFVEILKTENFEINRPKYLDGEVF